MQDTREGEETESIIPHNTFYTQQLGSHEAVFTDPGLLQGCVLCTVLLH